MHLFLTIAELEELLVVAHDVDGIVTDLSERVEQQLILAHVHVLFGVATHVIEIAVVLVLDDVVSVGALRGVHVGVDENRLLDEIDVVRRIVVHAAVEGLAGAVVLVAFVTVHGVRVDGAEDRREWAQERLVECLLAAAHAHVEQVAHLRVWESFVCA